MKRRNTPSKDAVLSLLAGSGRAMSQDAIEKQIGIAVDRATIYRILSRFCDDGVLHRVTADDGKQYFALCRTCEEKKTRELPDNHFHFRCAICQTIECLPALVQFSVPKGYRVEQLNCMLVGVCKDCS